MIDSLIITDFTVKEEKEQATPSTVTRVKREKELTEILVTMDLPAIRKRKFTNANLRWLRKNMKVKNKGHEKLDAAIKLVNHLII